MKNSNFHHETIVSHAIEGIQEMINSERTIYASDLHHYLFNEDYFLIGYYHCNEWLKEVTGNNIFKAIGEIQEYEIHNFGEVNTRLTDSEKVANMYAYILGETLLNELTTLRKVWDNKIGSDELQAIVDELKEL